MIKNLNMGSVIQKGFTQPMIPTINDNNYNSFLLGDTQNNFMTNALESFKHMSQNMNISNLNPNFSLDNFGNVINNDHFAQNVMYNFENSVYNNSEFPIKPNIINGVNAYHNNFNNIPTYNSTNTYYNQISQNPQQSLSNQSINSYLKSNNIITDNNRSNIQINSEINDDSLLKQIRPRSIKNNKIVFCHSKKKKIGKKDLNADFKPDVNTNLLVIIYII